MNNRSKWVFFLFVLAAVIVIGVIDYYTDPMLDLEILYFIPITLAAWSLGRRWAAVIVVAALVPVYAELRVLAAAGQISEIVVAVDMVVRVLVYAFVAELVYRLVMSRQEVRRTSSELRRTYEDIDQDVMAAGLLQATMLENPIPRMERLDVASRIELARTVGGDFREAVPFDDSLHVVIGDVSGKSVPAALFTTLLKHLLDEARDISPRPADVVEYVNSQLERRLPDEMFISLFYGSIRTTSLEMSFVNAGHEPALIYHPDSDSFDELASSLMVMGLDSYEKPIEQITRTLHPGDVLLLYTDGVTDARLPGGELLGMDFLKRMMRETASMEAENTLDRVMEEIRRLTGDIQYDDLTLLCVKVRE